MEYRLGDLINVEPKTSSLNAHELTTLRHLETEPFRLGLKRTEPTGTQEEKEELQKLYADLRRQLSTPRIERLAGRALAVWNAETGTVEVLRKDGRFEYFGYSQLGKHYLEYFEAMFLLELNRLQLEFNSKLVSIEQAYEILLGETSSHKYNEYLVYSTLSRVGYILVKHRNERFNEKTKVTQADCVWKLLLSFLKKSPIPEHVKKSPFYLPTREAMEEIKTDIIQQRSCIEKANVSTTEPQLEFNKKLTIGKRQHDGSCASDERSLKRVRTTEGASSSQSLIDFLKDEPEYKHFESIFEKFNIIKLKSQTINDGNCRNLRINFDVYLHNEGFKKSAPKPPAFRVIILDSNEPFPTHTEISVCHRQQLHPVPLLIVTVSESKQIQAFLYFFS